jgi:hypothetical protein
MTTNWMFFVGVAFVLGRAVLPARAHGHAAADKAN